MAYSLNTRGRIMSEQVDMREPFKLEVKKAKKLRKLNISHLSKCSGPYFMVFWYKPFHNIFL